MMKLKSILFVLAFLIWILLSWPVDVEHLIAGIIIGLLVSYLTADIFVDLGRGRVGFRRYLWFFYYIPLFIWECIKANLDGAYRVIHPDVPIKPGIVKVKTTLKSETGLTFLANTLSLKPGTMTVDIDREKGFLYVHWVDVKSQDVSVATEELVSKFERILKKIFD